MTRAIPMKFSDPVATGPRRQGHWKVLIVDDEKDVHEITKMALNRFTFDERDLEFLHAYSSDQAKNLLDQHPDTAVMLLDVVMETDDAGLLLVKYVREVLNNHLIRIVLRTGQPGYAPEREVITEYDINDYKSKTELTAQKLFTTMVASLRSYRAEHALMDEKEKIRLILQSITDGVISTDSQGIVSYMNGAAEYITGISIDEARNKQINELCTLLDPASQEPLECPTQTAIEKQETIELGNKVLLQRTDGENRIIGGSVAPTVNHLGIATGAVFSFHDLTLSQNMEKMLSWQQSHDTLTDLINRREFESYINRAIHETSFTAKNTFLLYLDINNFKVINDSCGHIAGDLLLVEIADVLSRNVERPDILGRVGSDEFGILLTQYDDSKDALDFADQLLKQVEEHEFIWSTQRHKISASIGIVPVNSECEGISCVLSAANIACEAAKESQGNNINFFTEQNSDLLQKRHELTWASRLSRSVQHGEFQLWCQKIMSINDESSTDAHYEILVRLEDSGKLLGPGVFIPAAEKYNLMPSIDRWIIDTTIKALSDWHTTNSKSHKIFCSINLSGTSLCDPKLIDDIKQTFERHDYPPEMICFEITETATIAHMGKASQLINEIKQLGCKFSLDDFGSGLSSFAYLRQLPVDYLKIDGQFIKDIHVDDINFAMVSTINSIGEIMGIKTVAEYVENEEVLRKLKDIGVDYGQGFAISRPEPFDNMLSLHA